MNEQLPTQWIHLNPQDIARMAPVQHIAWPTAQQLGIDISIKREDLLDKTLGGNKIYKLYGHLTEYVKSASSLPISTFGGAYSNHLHALSGACQSLNIPLIAYVRGEKPKTLSPTLHDLQQMGARLIFLSRSDYKRREQTDFLRHLEQQYGNSYWIPEGGSGEASHIGCQALGQAIYDEQAGTVVHACGTGATLAGIIEGVYKQHNIKHKKLPNVLGVSSLKSDTSIVKSIYNLTSSQALNTVHWRLTNRYCTGGYAKKPAYLNAFIDTIESQLNIPLDSIYTAKVFWAVECLLKKNTWKAGTRILLIHSGGLQGERKIQVAQSRSAVNTKPYLFETQFISLNHD